MIKDFLKYLVLWYIGEPGGYGTWGRNRAVFYSDSATPVIQRIVKYSEVKLYDEIENLREEKSITRLTENRHILSRFEDLLDSAGKIPK